MQIILPHYPGIYLASMRKLLILLTFTVYSCEAPMNQETVNYEGETILVGDVNWSGLTEGTYGEWFIPEYQRYAVYIDALTASPEQLDDVSIKVFLGTWCEDSRFQVPQFYKILDYLQFDHNQLELIALERLEDRTLVSPGGKEKVYQVGFVPTYIFERDGKELGRITEFPEVSLEADISKILNQ